MKNEIRRYFPNFFDVDESDRIVVPFETLEELLKIPFVKNWTTIPEFYQFASLSSRLIGQLRGGYEWWVIGTLKHPVEGLVEHTIPKDYYSDWPRSNFKGKLSDFQGVPLVKNKTTPSFITALKGFIKVKEEQKKLRGAHEKI